MTDFHAVLESASVTPIRQPPRSSNLNPYAERFVRSVKEECMDRIVPLGETHLRAAIGEFLVHDHEERNHQGLGNRLISQPAEVVSFEEAIRRRERVGGVPDYYYREAA